MSQDKAPNLARTKSIRRSPVIPVSLTEAALDSPTFRTAAVHFADQVDGIERWLDGYLKSTSRLAQDVIALDDSINNYLRQLIPAQAVADTVIDHEYTQLGLKRVGDGARDYWTQVQAMARRMDVVAADPIKTFLQNDLKAFKEARRLMDNAQKAFDTTLARYLSMSKTKEPSALREDAFAVFETRKVYLKSSLDYCQLAPQLRNTLDDLLIRISSDLWNSLKQHRATATNSPKWNTEIDRVKGWCKDMESSAGVFKREVHLARREIGEAALLASRPSRDIEDYSSSTVAFLSSSRGPSSANAPKEGEPVISERQGWLFLKVTAGKPVRTTWTRRWFYCRDGIFGWLVQAPHGVLQGDEIGVLLCNAKPALGEDRRFCFQVKTKSQTMILQAETQTELSDWLEVFEVAKKRAFEASVDKGGASALSGANPAFSITPPTVPEFSAKVLEAIMAGEEGTGGALAVPNENLALSQRTSFDVNGPARRSISNLGRELAREDGESNREHAARIIQKLDLHRKATFGTTPESAPSPASNPAGGIASLISASHTFLPGYNNMLPRHAAVGGLAGLDIPPGSLAPPYLAASPIPTNLSKLAVAVTAERGLAPDVSRAMSTAVMANYWGSNPWSSVYMSTSTNYHRLTDVDTQQANALRRGSSFRSERSGAEEANPTAETHHPDRRLPEKFPPGYPPELKAQHAQFRLLFPHVPMDEKLVLVFRATWMSSGERGFEGPTLAGNGRIYVTPDNMYFYGHQLGLVVAYSIGLDFIAEVTAHAGQDCDFVVLRLGQDFNDTGLTRITIKTFLEDVRLLHARLNLLVDDLQAEEPMDVDEIVTQLICLEKEEHERRSPSVDSWEDVGFDNISESQPLPRRPHHIADRHARPGLPRQRLRSKVHLPTAPVVYEPEDMKLKVAERHFEIGAKACFHILFGDKSFIFPKLYFDRNARDIVQGPWILADEGRMKRQFTFKADSVDMLGRSKMCEVVDVQTIDVHRDHVAYEVTHVKTAWHLPHSQYFKVVTKVVITHIAKSKCKLAIYIKTDWKKFPSFSKSIVERQALNDAEADAEELAEAATDQVRRLGPRSRTKRAIQVYGHIGHESQPTPFTPATHADSAKKPAVQPRTLTEMVYETLRSLAQSAVTSILMWAFAGLRGLLKVLTAHRVILLVTALSLLANVFLTSMEGSTWWKERSASRLMGRLGVGPNVMMSKAVYLEDLESAQGPSAANITWAKEGSACFTAFQAINSATSLDSPYEDAGAHLSSASSRATAQRLRRMRQRLGAYRHDLLVAMRIVNSVEREMLQSEWENWLVDENSRCDHLRSVLKAGSDAGGDVDSERRERARAWVEGYCGSCWKDMGALREEKRLAF
ncbi:hypothetical protein jhhlp_000266 [Lomentospora prolificans]|uniref:Uncharacterized protein n=1 Tax=Lomentospora prolificans TaxID=41688 RepID=A0A2N3NKF0_9PEZI|nr:hypothetical protein jhhlp_000266 [Lomentospora prolificans]